jgi:hypothetical protein
MNLDRTASSSLVHPFRTISSANDPPAAPVQLAPILEVVSTPQLSDFPSSFKIFKQQISAASSPQIFSSR